MAAGSSPVPQRGSLTASGTDTLALLASGGSGPLVDPHASNPIGAAAAGIAPAKATNATDIGIRATSRRLLQVAAAPASLVTRDRRSERVDRSLPARVY